MRRPPACCSLIVVVAVVSRFERISGARQPVEAGSVATTRRSWGVRDERAWEVASASTLAQDGVYDANFRTDGHDRDGGARSAARAASRSPADDMPNASGILRSAAGGRYKARVAKHGTVASMRAGVSLPPRALAAAVPGAFAQVGARGRQVAAAADIAGVKAERLFNGGVNGAGSLLQSAPQEVVQVGSNVYWDWGVSLRIEEKLREGSFGIVYRASVRNCPGADGEPIALKVIDCCGPSISWAMFREEVEREVHLMQRLSSSASSRAFVRYLGHKFRRNPLAFLGKSRAYIAMQLADTDLFEFLHEGEQKMTNASAFSRDLMFAVGALHYLGYAHRDLKLENILLRGKDAAVRPLIADMGLACSADIHDPIVLPCWKACAGTFEYLAPEAFTLGRRAFERHAFAMDAWAIGFVVCYVVLPDDFRPELRQPGSRWLRKGEEVALDWDMVAVHAVSAALECRQSVRDGPHSDLSPLLDAALEYRPRRRRRRFEEWWYTELARRGHQANDDPDEDEHHRRLDHVATCLAGEDYDAEHDALYGPMW